MENFFNPDNAFFTALGKVADLVILNIYFLCTVLLGVGPACTAMYYAMMKNVRKNRNYLTKCYFHSFKQNFRQGFIIGIIQVLFGAAITYCIGFALTMNASNTLGRVYFWGLMVFVVFYLMAFIYVYPLLSRYNLTVGAALKTGFVLGMHHFLTSIILVAMLVLTAGACYYFTFYMFTPLVLILPSLYTLASTFLLERCFRKSIPEPEVAEGVDAWWRDDDTSNVRA